VALTCNLSYLGSGGRRKQSKMAGARAGDPIYKNGKSKRTGGLAQRVKYLPGKHKPTPAQPKYSPKEEKGQGGTRTELGIALIPQAGQNIGRCHGVPPLPCGVHGGYRSLVHGQHVCVHVCVCVDPWPCMQRSQKQQNQIWDIERIQGFLSSLRMIN
jgi:hypothetical protein